RAGEGEERRVGECGRATGGDPVAEQDIQAEYGGGQQTSDQRADHGLAEGRAEQRGQLDVTQAHAGRIEEQRNEEKESCANRGNHPLESSIRRQRDLGEQNDDQRREDDEVRDQAPVEVDRREQYEHRGEQGLDDRA